MAMSQPAYCVVSVMNAYYGNFMEYAITGSLHTTVKKSCMQYYMLWVGVVMESCTGSRHSQGRRGGRVRRGGRGIVAAAERGAFPPSRARRT
jgi:hypothetical protein